MEKKNLVFNQDEFQEFVVNNLREVFPHKIIEKQDFFQIKVNDSNANRTALIDLRNAWASYERNNDLNSILEYLEAIVDVQFHLDDDEENFIFHRDKEIIFPAVRNIARKSMQMNIETKDDIKENELITDDLTGDLIITYVLDYPKFTSTLSKHMLLDNLRNETNKEQSNEELLQTKGYHFLEDLVREQAIENIKKKGWVKPLSKKKTSFGTIMKFGFDKYDYQFQFFIKEWAKKHLGYRFFISFPNKYVTLVVVPIGGTDSIKKTSLKWLQMETYETIRRKGTNIISKHLFQYNADDGWSVEVFY